MVEIVILLKINAFSLNSVIALDKNYHYVWLSKAACE